MAHHYFAYGSNMNPERVAARQMGFRRFEAGTLLDYRLAFNKRSARFPGSASANVMQAKGDWVEGVVYELEGENQIEVMDPFETYPILYDRRVLPIRVATGIVEAWVYIANQEHVQEGLKPNRWYIAHLQKGEPFLTPQYFQRLAAIDCLPDSDIEPQ